MKEAESVKKRVKLCGRGAFVYRETIGASFFCLFAGGLRHSGEPQWRAYIRDLGKRQKAGGGEVKIISECPVHSKETDWKFENGMLYNSNTDKIIGGDYQKWHSTQETQSRSGGGRAVFQVKGLETGEEQLKLKRFTSRVRKRGNRDI